MNTFLSSQCWPNEYFSKKPTFFQSSTRSHVVQRLLELWLASLRCGNIMPIRQFLSRQIKSKFDKILQNHLMATVSLPIVFSFRNVLGMTLNISPRTRSPFSSHNLRETCAKLDSRNYCTGCLSQPSGHIITQYLLKGWCYTKRVCTCSRLSRLKMSQT